MSFSQHHLSHREKSDISVRSLESMNDAKVVYPGILTSASTSVLDRDVPTYFVEQVNNVVQESQSVKDGKKLQEFAQTFADEVIVSALDVYQQSIGENVVRENVGDEECTVDILGNLTKDGAVDDVLRKISNDEAQPVIKRHSDRDDTEERLLKLVVTVDDITAPDEPLGVIGEEPEISTVTEDDLGQEQTDILGDLQPKQEVRVRSPSSMKLRKTQLSDIEKKLKERMNQIVNMPLVHHHLGIAKRMAMLAGSLGQDFGFEHRECSATRIPQQIKSHDFFPALHSNKLG